MKIKTIVLSSLLLAILFSCDVFKKDTDMNLNMEILEVYSNGNIKQGLWSFDTAFVIMKFDNKGILLDSIPYNKDSLVHGIRKTYKEDEGVKYFAFTKYENDVGNGIMIAKYLNGEIYCTGEYEDGKKIKSWIFYYQNGSISSYKFYDFKGKLSYYRMIDTNGALIKTDGDGIGYLEYKNATIRKGQEFICRVNVANPPNCDIKALVAEELDENGSPTDELYQYELIDGSFIYNKKFADTGVFEKGFGWLLTDTINNIEEKDFNILKITVTN